MTNDLADAPPNKTILFLFEPVAPQIRPCFYLFEVAQRQILSTLGGGLTGSAG